jgi:hypothetical protein
MLNYARAVCSPTQGAQTVRSWSAFCVIACLTRSSYAERRCTRGW